MKGERRGPFEGAFRLALRCHPPGFRERYGTDLIEYYRLGWAERAQSGTSGIRYASGAIRGALVAGVKQRTERWRVVSTREERGRGMWRDDLRQAGRRLRRRPGLSAIVVLTLGLGLGANTAVFSLIQSVLLAPLPYEEPGELIRIYATGSWAPGEAEFMSAPASLAIRDQATTLAAVAYLENYSPRGVDLTDGESPERVRMMRVTSDYFEVLRVSPFLGRPFSRADETERPTSVVVSEGVWERHLGGTPDAVGSTLTMDGATFTVAGVMDATFEDPIEGRIDVWLPSDTRSAADDDWGNHYLSVIARLAPDATIDQARAELAALSDRHQALDEDADDYLAFPLKDDLVGGAEPLLMTLAGAVVFLLLLTCVNVASLILAEMASRSRELAVRKALGSARWPLVRQLMLETTVLALLGGVAGVLLGSGALEALIALAPASVVRTGGEGLGYGAVLLAGGLAVAVGVVIGLLTAVTHSRPDLETSLLASGRTGGESKRQRRTRRVMVLAEVAMAIILLCGAGVLVRSLGELRSADLGITPASVVTFQVNLPTTRYPDAESRVRFYDQYRSAVSALPGVESVGAVSWLPTLGSYHSWGSRPAVAVGVPADVDNAQTEQRVVDGDYFWTMGMELLKGRTFDARDEPDATNVVVVSKSWVDRFFPDEEPIGKLLRVAGRYPEIIGVVEDVPITIRGEVRPMIYHSHPQFADNRNWRLNQVVRTSGDVGAVLAAIRNELAGIDPNLVLHLPRPLVEVIGRGAESERFATILIGAFGFLAALLATMGLYGLLAHSVVRQRHEIGVRMALGASRRGVRRTVVARGLGLAVVGSLIGVSAAIPLLGALDSLVYGIPARDPAVLLGVPVLFALVSVLASYLPARQATRVDPVESFRPE